MISFILAWYLIGFMSLTYVVLVDSVAGATHGDSTLEMLSTMLFFSLFGPFVTCFAAYVAFHEWKNAAFYREIEEREQQRRHDCPEN